MNPFSDEKIVDSWEKNACSWSQAVRAGEIESRELVTNNAIVEAVLSRNPRDVLDVGCGEGWLVRELANDVPNLLGVDVVPELIQEARSAGRGEFLLASYDDIAKAAVADLFDVIVCNFSLLGKESVETLFANVAGNLKAGGAFIVQTLHPLVANTQPYIDGWREGSWEGIGSDFVDPAPWYFRTLESWVALFADNGFELQQLREPINPKTQRPASIIFTGVRKKL